MVSLTPLKVTASAEERFSPLIDTVLLTAPALGEKPVTTGPAPVRKLLAVVTLPLVVLTVMGPVTAPTGTVTAISVVDTISASLAVTEPNLTSAPAKKLPPKMVTDAPIAAAVGENEAIVGRLLARKLLVLTLVPALVVTVIGPLPA